MLEAENFFNVLFILSPAIGFVPQILASDIIFPEVLSLLSIIASILKLSHYVSEPFSSLIALQAVFIIILHFYLIRFNTSDYSSVEKLFFKFIGIHNLNKKYGNKTVYLGLVSFTIVTLHMLGLLFGTLSFCGIISLFFELSINVLQVAIENDKKDLVLNENKRKRSPKELYLFWTIGDMVKIWYMTKIIIPKVYLATAVLQLILDGYLLVA
ncbi:hypothetical protein NBO_16g0030 [Nosema bombycis CQ1]|uniref:Uncharacterized protein n=1 Tax=Nosema bombycis (strain CQ1 / CVCC 102059) TaxID=578461 RepID=R0M9U3_NOSB1|nr:hypothetical protein NBO_16g0030 [Nosema bombycis CQ1]|eukprot:EOB14744.1 hypothetical protein NBO_16g0030 [Nosema bombycis CQ1]